MPLSNKTCKEMYITMKRCRAFEEQAQLEHRNKRILGSCHCSVGQEAIAAGVGAALEKNDYILATHRGHSEIIAKGARLDKMMAELFARETGYCRGKVGSMHIVAIDCNVLTCSAIVGASIPIACGVALANKLKQTNRVTVCFMGDGATFTGAFHEGVGIAAGASLPLVFVCENNQYAITTPWRANLKLENIADRAKGYGIPGVSIDGMDAITVAETAGEAISRARNGGGPTFIEGRTFRYYGHGAFEPGTSYRSSEEIATWKSRDPIAKLRLHLMQKGLLTEDEDRAIDRSAMKEVEDAVRFAEESPETPFEEIWNSVYFGEPLPQADRSRQCEK